MNTTKNEEKLINIAVSHYDGIMSGDFKTIASNLHEDVQLISPLAEVKGRDVIVESAKTLHDILNNVEIRAKFCSGSQVMLAFDFFFKQEGFDLRSAVLMTFSKEKISKIELFYDGRPFEK